MVPTLSQSLSIRIARAGLAPMQASHTHTHTQLLKLLWVSVAVFSHHSPLAAASVCVLVGQPLGVSALAPDAGSGAVQGVAGVGARPSASFEFSSLL